MQHGLAHLAVLSAGKSTEAAASLQEVRGRTACVNSTVAAVVDAATVVAAVVAMATAGVAAMATAEVAAVAMANAP